MFLRTTLICLTSFLNLISQTLCFLPPIFSIWKQLHFLEDIFVLLILYVCLLLSVLNLNDLFRSISLSDMNLFWVFQISSVSWRSFNTTCKHFTFLPAALTFQYCGGGFLFFSLCFCRKLRPEYILATVVSYRVTSFTVIFCTRSCILLQIKEKNTGFPHFHGPNKKSND